MEPEPDVGAHARTELGGQVVGEGPVEGEQRPVETGDAIGGGLRIVRSGLLPEERVIVSGTQRAVPGNTVRPIESVAIATP